VKVGDLVVRRDRGYGPPNQPWGLVMDSYEADTGVVYYEVQWIADLEEDRRMWYDVLELRVVSESR
jgi:hypothetical protein